MLSELAAARVSEPERVAAVLRALKLESADPQSWLGDLGALDKAERLEMAAEMRGDGVALGDRSKLRRLAAGRRTTGGAPSPGLPDAGHYT